MILRSVTPLFLAAFLLALGASSVEAAGVAWTSDLKKAAAESERTGKPILLQVTADWCKYCHKMLRETYPDKKLARYVNEHFVPVVLDADENEKIVDAIGITAFPSTIIISPKLDVIGRVRGYHTPRSLEKRLTPFGRKGKPQTEAVLAEKPVKKPGEEPLTKAPRLPAVSIPAASDPPPTVPEASFDGLCLVSMLKDRKRTQGKSEYSTVFRNRRLHFASEEHLQVFRSESERFWPLLDGRCPVAQARGEKNPQGDPKTVAVFRGQLVFFRDLSHREDFRKNPRGYLEQARAGENAKNAPQESR